MKINLLIPILAFIINGFVWTFIFAQRKNNPINRAFLIYAANLELWILVVIFSRLPMPETLVISILKIGSVFWISSAFWFMNFTYVFLNKKKNPVYYLTLFSVITAVGITITTDLVIAGFNKLKWGIDELPGSIFLYLVIILIILPGFYSLYLIRKQSLRSTDNDRKQSLAIIYYSTFIILVIGILSNVIIPYLIKFNNFLQFAESITVIQSIFIFAAVKKYRLFTPGIEDFSHNFFDNMEISVLIVDNSGKIVQANPKAISTFKLLPFEPYQRRITSVINTYSVKDEHQNYEFQKFIDGKLKYFLINESINSDHLLLKGKILFIKDISERKYTEEKIKDDEAMLLGLFASAPYCLIVSNKFGRIVKINNQSEKTFGYSEDELLNATIEILIPERFRGKHLNHRLNYLNEPRVREMGSGLDLYARRKDGSEFPVDINLSYFEVKNDMLVIATIKDVTERKKADEIIKRSKLLLNQAEELAHLGSWEWIIKENRVIWSDELYKIYGFKPMEFVVTFELYLSRLHPNDRRYVQNIIEKALRDKEPFTFFERILRPDGEIRILLSRGIVNVDNNGEPDTLVGSCLDVTEFKKVENELRTSHAQLRALYNSLQSAREEERTHIAREIHDHLGQVLTAVKMDISLLSDKISRSKPVDISKDLMLINNMIDNLIQTVRNIATELRPEVLEHLGLLSAIDWQVNEFQNKTGIETFFNSEFENLEIENEKAIAIFRIFQETLTNIIRHAEATSVIINLKTENDFLLMETMDNGKGITDDQLSNIKSIGLIGMKERAHILDGELTIKNNPDGGTTVLLKVPLPSVYQLSKSYSKVVKE